VELSDVGKIVEYKLEEGEFITGIFGQTSTSIGHYILQLGLIATKLS
jgi:hypothetical protein